MTSYLGQHQSPAVGPSGAAVVRHVYVVWLADRPSLLDGLEGWARAGARCPECGRVWDLARAGGVLEKVRETAASACVVKVADSCPTCRAIVHWDATPAGGRAQLRWYRFYRQNAAAAGDRATRFPMAVTV